MPATSSPPSPVDSSPPRSSCAHRSCHLTPTKMDSLGLGTHRTMLASSLELHRQSLSPPSPLPPLSRLREREREKYIPSARAGAQYFSLPHSDSSAQPFLLVNGQMDFTQVFKKADAMGKPGLIEINAKEDSRVFTVETTGAVTAYELIINGITVLRQKLDAVRLQDDDGELGAHLVGG